MDLALFVSDLREMFQTEDTIEADTVLTGHDWWDSMAYLYVITYAEEKMNIDVEFDDLKPAKTVGELFALLASKTK